MERSLASQEERRPDDLPFDRQVVRVLTGGYAQ